MSKNGGDSRPNRMANWKKVPGRVLRFVCDAYVRSITSCARGVPHGASMGYPVPGPTYFPEPYNVAARSPCNEKPCTENRISSCWDDCDGEKEDDDDGVPTMSRRELRRMPVVGRIDEDKVCEFRGVDDISVGCSLLDPNPKMGLKSQRCP